MNFFNGGMMLYSLFNNFNGECVFKYPHYFPIYERYFKDFINKSGLLIEIGVYKGGSLQMWKNYLGPLFTIVGIDINSSCKKYEDDQCYVRIGNQSDYNFLNSIVKEFGHPDIVIDDGSHRMDDTYNAFKFLYHHLNNNGVYIIEDMHTCYNKKYGGGLKNSDSFIEKSKELIDVMNSFHFLSDKDVPELTKNIYSISYYDSLVVFEKKKHQRPYALKRGQNII